MLVHALINLVYDAERNLNHILQREDEEHDAQRFLASGLDIRVQKLQVLLRTKFDLDVDAVILEVVFIVRVLGLV